MLYTNYYGCCRLFQTIIKNCKVLHLKSTYLNCIRVTQNRGQKVFNRSLCISAEGLWLCAGGLDTLKIDKISTDL